VLGCPPQELASSGPPGGYSKGCCGAGVVYSGAVPRPIGWKVIFGSPHTGLLKPRHGKLPGGGQKAGRCAQTCYRPKRQASPRRGGGDVTPYKARDARELVSRGTGPRSGRKPPGCGAIRGRSHVLAAAIRQPAPDQHLPRLKNQLSLASAGRRIQPACPFARLRGAARPSSRVRGCRILLGDRQSRTRPAAPHLASQSTQCSGKPSRDHTGSSARTIPALGRSNPGARGCEHLPPMRLNDVALAAELAAGCAELRV
jgi:hypothetical protein